MEASAIHQPSPGLDLLHTRVLTTDPAMRQLLVQVLEEVAAKDGCSSDFIDPDGCVSRQRASRHQKCVCRTPSAVERQNTSGLPTISALVPKSEEDTHREFDPQLGLLAGRRDSPFQFQWIAADVLVKLEKLRGADGHAKSVALPVPENTQARKGLTLTVETKTPQRQTTPQLPSDPPSLRTASTPSTPCTPGTPSPTLGSLAWIERMSVMSPASRTLAAVGLVRTVSDSGSDSSRSSTPTAGSAGATPTATSLRQQLARRRHVDKTVLIQEDDDSDVVIPLNRGSTGSVLRAHIASRIHFVPPGKFVSFYITVEKILTVALPLLARLRRPALLLPGPLQVVVKAHRGGATPEEEWQVVGKHEHIVAVVLYFFDGTQMDGVVMEFADKVGARWGCVACGAWCMVHVSSVDLLSAT